MQLTRYLAGRVRPPAFFCEADSVLARDHAAPCKHLLEKVIERAIDFFSDGSVAVVTVRHDIDMNVAVTGVAEAGDRKSVFSLQRLCELLNSRRRAQSFSQSASPVAISMAFAFLVSSNLRMAAASL